MPLSKVQLDSGLPRADALYEYLRGAILSGVLQPNERLVETEIARLSGVSRTPVREALHKLLIDKLVEDTGRGLVVRSVTREQLSDLCAVREVLEGMASRLAAIRRPSFELSELALVAEEFNKAGEAGDVAAMVEQNGKFHESIWRASGNRYLADLLRTLRERVEQLQVTTLSAAGRAETAAGEHAEILAAISAGDADTAERIAMEHFREAMVIRVSMQRTVDGASREAGQVVLS